MQARSLGRENPLEEEMAAHSSIPAWRIPWTEEPAGLQSVCVCVCRVASVMSDSLQPVDYGLPGSYVLGILQGRILEWAALISSRGTSQLRDQTRISDVSCTACGFFTTGATWEAQGAKVHGVAKSWTRLKRLMHGTRSQKEAVPLVATPDSA